MKDSTLDDDKKTSNNVDHDIRDAGMSISLRVEGDTTISGSLNVSSDLNVENLQISDTNIFANSSANYLNFETKKDGGYFRFRTGDIDVLRISSDGNVGIGTTDPSATLHVAGDATISGTLNVTGNNSTIGNLSIIENDDYLYLSHSDQTAYDNSFALRQHNTGETTINSASGKSIYFNINNDEKMILDDNGNLVIGTSTTISGEKMTLYSENTNGLYVSYHGTESSGIVVNNRKGNHNLTYKVADFHSVCDPTQTGYAFVASDTIGTTEGTRTCFIKYSGESYFAGDTTVLGNVGIGTTDPLTALDVSGDATISGDTTIGGSLDVSSYLNIANLKLSNTNIYANTSAEYLNIETNNPDGYIRLRTKNNDVIRISSDGNVGIGTTDPSATLHVAGDATISGDTTISGSLDVSSDLYIANLNLSNTNIYANTSADYLNFETQKDGGYFRFRTGGNDVLRISSDGNVGIGTTNPSSKLDVSGSVIISEEVGTAATASGGSLTLIHNDYANGSSGGTSSIVFKSNVESNIDYGYIEYRDDYDYTVPFDVNGSHTDDNDQSILILGTANDHDDFRRRDRIALMPGNKGDGYVGINKENPQATLDVSGNTNISGTLTVTGNTTIDGSVVIDYNKSFRYIFFKFNEPSSTLFKEIECYIEGSNVALNKSVYLTDPDDITDTSHTIDGDENYATDHYVDGNITSSSFNNSNCAINDGNDILIDLNTNYKINDIQRIIIYNRSDIDSTDIYSQTSPPTPG